MQQRAQAASARGRHEWAARTLRKALDSQLEITALERVRLLISLAWAEAEINGLPEGLAVLDQAAELAAVTQTPTALLHGQRGLLLLRAGHFAPARVELQLAADELPVDDPERIKVLINRGVTSLRMGALGSAGEDFEASLTAAKAAGLAFEEAASIDNLGYLALLRGDIPDALRMAADAERILAPQSPWLAGVCARGRADVLMAAGLFTEAAEEYQRAVTVLTKPGHRQERGQAALGLAEIDRLRGSYSTARTWARRAARYFESRGAAGWSLLAELELTRIEAQVRPRRAEQLASELEDRLIVQGLREEAASARLLRIRALLARGLTAEADELASRPLPGGRGTRMANRMLAYEVRAQLHEAMGRTGLAQRTRRRGLRDLHGYQARFGSVDLLTAATRIGTDLAIDGLRAALSSGRAGAILEWSEQLRASARMPSVRPPRDQTTADLLASLRHVQASQRSAKLDGESPDPAWAGQAAILRREIRRQAWHATAEREVAKPVGLATLHDALGPDAVALALMTVDDRVHALTIDGRSARHQDLCGVDVRDVILRVRADLDQLAKRRLPASMRARVVASLDSGLARIDTLLRTALGAQDIGGPVVIVPSGQASLIPWMLLPVLRQRLVCVVPSLTWWVGQRARGPLELGRREVHIAGPELDRALPEVLASAHSASTATVLTGDEATVGATLAAMDACDVLHVAAHGQHEPDNPLFSRLLLADGWLYGYDLDLVERLPTHAVLSACEAGMASIRPGEETLGLTAALLHGGCRSVISSVASVNDGEAERIAVAHHAALRRGDPPARALAEALVAGGPEFPAPLVCFGLGW